jgi:photosystem II stability/assembly factor-like uncharacterized protein
MIWFKPTRLAAPIVLMLALTVQADSGDPTRRESVAHPDGSISAIVPVAGARAAPILARGDSGQSGIASITWEKMTVPGGLYLRAISMGSPTVGFAAGELGVVVRTVDGGDTWQTILNQGFPYYYYGVHALDELHVVISGFQNATGEGIIRWSEDGGDSWGPVISLVSPGFLDWLIGVEFAGKGFGVVQGFSGQVFASTTGGRTADDWAVSTPSENWYLGTFTVLGDGRAWISGYDTVYSDDFGQEWSMLPGADPLFDGPIAVRAGGKGFTGGGSISPQVAGWVYGTDDGGASWTDERILDTAYPVRALMFLDDRRAWAAGGNVYSNVGGIWGTEDGGQTWALEQDIGNEILDLDQVRVDDQTVHVFAAGYISQIWRATVTTAGCAPDLNGDGQLDLFDFLEYVNRFNAGDIRADCTGDQVLDLFDFLCYVNLFNEGC